MNSLILRTTTQLLLPLLLLFSLFLLFRGHNEPGGGFIAGLVASTALILTAIAGQLEQAKAILRVDPHYIIAAGLLTAIAAATFSLFMQDTLFTGHWWQQPIPLLGKIGTPFIFDIGVYLTVLGFSLKIIFTLADE